MMNNKGYSQGKIMKTILAGYGLIILCGAVLLYLPISIKVDTDVAFIDALFTAVSATCVTGLVVFDTYSQWTVFGQLVILLMVQIGGVGFMTFAIFVITLTHRPISLRQRSLIRDSLSASQLGGIVRISRFILGGCILLELLGMLLLAIRFCPLLGFGEGLYFALYHSICA
ncbi:MAG: potassium transporter TrkG, partial [Clostridiales bacterium]